MSEQASTIGQKSHTKTIKKVAFAEIALKRLRSRLPGSSLSRRDELSSISISDPEQLEEEQLVGDACVDSKSGKSTESEVRINSRSKFNRTREPGISISVASVWPSEKQSRKIERKTLEDITRAPEQAITLFAFRLAILETAARGAGALTFFWATVVLLGGFSSYVSTTDFWVVACLLLTEGSRIFLLSNELEWQQASSRASLYAFGSRLAHKSNRVVTGIIHHSPGYSSTDERSAWFTHTGVVPIYGSPPSHVASPEVPLAIQQSKRVQRIAAGLVSKPAQRTWSASMLPLLPYTQIVSAKGMATLLYIGQLISALVCLALSLWRLVFHDFLGGGASASNDLNETVVRSLYAFYVMAFLEAFFFLVEKTYWEYKISYQGLFERVDKEAELKGECVETIRSFFYKVYSRSLAISVFAGLEMDLVSYSMELLQNDDEKEVLGSSRILKTFVERQHASHGDTLRRIGIKPGAIDRLVEMLAWHHQDEEEVRLNSAAIVKALVSSTRNGSRVIAVSGSLENIMSLIQWDDVDRILHAEGMSATIQPLKINILRNYGLSILKSLALDHANCRRIGETRGLLAKLVDFIDIHRPWIRTPEGAKTIRQSLQLLNLLASTAGNSGSILRPAITNVVSAIPHLRDILHSRVTKTSKDLHELAVDVLKHLALDETSRKVIGSTGGVISNLMLLFTRRSLHQMPFQHRYSSHDDSSTKEAAVKEEVNLAKKAGTVLMRLALQSEENCHRILRTRFSDPSLRACTVLLRILQLEENEDLSTHAAGILRATFINMSLSTKAEVSRESKFLLNRAILCKSCRVQEAVLGLAIALRCLSDEEFTSLFETQTVNRTQLVDRLMVCLSHAPSTTKRPKTRRYALELIFILLSRDNEAFKPLFAEKDLSSTLLTVLDNISDVENYLLFSGGMGLTRHNVDMESLVLKVFQIFDADNR